MREILFVPIIVILITIITLFCVIFSGTNKECYFCKESDRSVRVETYKGINVPVHTKCVLDKLESKESE